MAEIVVGTGHHIHRLRSGPDPNPCVNWLGWFGWLS